MLHARGDGSGRLPWKSTALFVGIDSATDCRKTIVTTVYRDLKPGVVSSVVTSSAAFGRHGQRNKWWWRVGPHAYR